MAKSAPDHIQSRKSSESLPNSSHDYPFAAAPDIIRANQKDAYFQSVLFEQFSTILRKLHGVRVAQNYNSESTTLAELLYLALTTLVGNRTLGEEYCDIIQVSDSSLRLPSFARRAGYILSVVLLPYTLTKILPVFRNRVRSKLEGNLQRSVKSSNPSSRQQLQAYLLEHLSTLTSLSPIHALTLSVFYFTGSYYHLSKRVFGLRYIFTKRLAPSDQRVGYEVLGVLLVLQIAVQGWLHLHNTFKSPPLSVLDIGTLRDRSAIVDGVEVGLGRQNLHTNAPTFQYIEKSWLAAKSRLEIITHTPLAEGTPYDLKAPGTMGWIQGHQQRKCTLCLEAMKDPSVTTCGHVFCWTCIGDWVKEKPECPLCRQGTLLQHILPLRG